MPDTTTKHIVLTKDFKSLSSFLRTRRTFCFVYGFTVAFVAITILLVFNPSPSTSSFTTTTTDYYSSQVSSFFSHVFPTNSTTLKESNFSSVPVQNSNPRSQNTITVKFQTQSKGNSVKSSILNQTTTLKSPILSTQINETDKASQNYVKAESFKSNHTKKEAPKIPADKLEKVIEVMKNTSHAQSEGGMEQRGKVNSVVTKKKATMEDLMKCDLFDGEWIIDESYPLYKPGSCSFIDEQFNCVLNGRPDKDFQKYKWKPHGCSLPRLNAGRLLRMLTGKRLVFVGDSLNRNMWESMVCILKGAAKNQRNVFEVNGRQSFRGEASYSFVFKDYKFTVEFFVAPFLVQEWEVVEKNGTKKETLRLDLITKLSEQYKDADIIVFNTGHWWTHEKTSKGEDYYQEGNHVHEQLNVLEAFRKALTTWGRWVDSKVNPIKSQVFFRGYSASHFFGGQWNAGGACDNEVEPIKNSTYLTEYPSKMVVLEKVLKGMKTNVKYLNVTRMTDYRKDAHPSIYRKQKLTDEERKKPLLYQDCSHWCLPGVPDAWNEILYTELLINEYQKKQVQSSGRG